MTHTASSDTVRIVEVGPRDGLQNEKSIVPAATKVALVDRLSACGFPVVEAGSFVSPKWVPQLADAEEVLPAIRRHDGVLYPVLVPNEKGLERALAADVREIAVFTAASDAFNLKNINCDIAESLRRIAPVVERAHAAGLWVRGYVSTVLGCPYQGEVPLADVTRVARELFALGCDEISLGDTIGVGTPHKARAMLEACAADIPMHQLAVHFHDTYGQALANVSACLDAGVRIVDSAVGGLGGCPYAQGASGNVASEDLIYMLHGLGLHTGVDLDAVCDTARWINSELKRDPVSRLARIPNARRFKAIRAN
jgi:hydroxymethylglutaryl-CoA lyase